MSESAKQSHWQFCHKCQGRGKALPRIPKKIRYQYEKDLEAYEKSDKTDAPPPRPKGHIDKCMNCDGVGIISAEVNPTPDKELYPHLAIIGGGIGGVALAVACLHRGIPYTLYEKDKSFNARSQGYGLTLQQASRSMIGFGISSLRGGIVSTKHVVHNTDGKILGEWGTRKWVPAEGEKIKPLKRTNIHIARQSLRQALVNQLGENNNIEWDHQLIDYKDNDDGVELNFKVNGELKTHKADLIVGADGIYSQVRRQLIGEENTPLQYLGCIVILGICPIKNIEGIESTLLDARTVFQTANGKERIYIMPFDDDTVMWQLSYMIPEEEAKALSTNGPQALKEEAIRICQWHDPIPQILKSTKEELVTGYPAYGRDLLEPPMFDHGKHVTLLGDAAHPMSPFKGQGANQALIDAHSLVHKITSACNPYAPHYKEVGLRESILAPYEEEMLNRSAKKVLDSASAAELLHTDAVLYEGDEPRGRCIRENRMKVNRSENL
jgi:salicylate hydroxylase